MKARNMLSDKGAVPNQIIITDNNNVEWFQSYDTIIATWENGVLYLDNQYWDYSRSTVKYRNQFTGLTTKQTKAGIADGTIKLVDLN